MYIFVLFDGLCAHVHVCPFTLYSFFILKCMWAFFLSSREQDDEISSLKSQKRKALTENEALRGQLQQQERVPVARQVTTGPSLSSSLRNLDLQYQATLEKGMYVCSLSLSLSLSLYLLYLLMYMYIILCIGQVPVPWTPRVTPVQQLLSPHLMKWTNVTGSDVLER